MHSITYQPFLRPVLPHVIGPKEYRQERALFIRIDEILATSGLENEFIARSMDHCGFAPANESVKRIDSFSRKCVLALRGNIARHFKGMDHRDFCIRLAVQSTAPVVPSNRSYRQSQSLRQKLQ